MLKGAALTKLASVKADAPSDEELVEASRTGSRRAFAELVERYHPLVCSVAFALTGSVSMSEEVAQETFVAAWRRLGDLRQADRFRSWLCGIARNLSRRSQRDERAAPATATGAPGVELALPAAGPSPLDEVIDREEESFLWRALGAIPETYRLPLVLYYREQHSIEKVARALDISETSVKTRLWRGRRLLQEQMAGLVESTLERTRPSPSKAFAAGVLAAIGASLPGTGRAATGLWQAARAGLAGGKPAALAGAALVAGAAAVGGWMALGRGGGDAAPPGSARETERASPTATRAAAARTRRTPPPAFAVAPAGTEAAALPPGGAAAAPAAEPAALLGFDFEDGALPPHFIEGQIVPGPPRPGNRFAAVGSVALRWRSPTTAVAWNPGRTHLSYSDRMTVSFDYWVAAGPEPVVVMIAAPGMVRVGDKDLARNFTHRLKGVVRERWAHAEVRFADFTPVVPIAPPFQAGETVLKVQFFGSQAGGGQFFVDNVKVLDYGAADPPRTATAPLDL
jgi:RNA polymerase sigma factor (sigma-70 family)